MANYLDHYGLEREPFGDRPGDVVLATRPVRAVLKRIRSDLAVGSTQICVYGEPGVGKSSLARSLPAVLRQSEAVAGVARIGNPKWDWEETRRSIGRQLGLGDGPLSRTRLMAACGHGRRLVLVVDSAHRLSYEILDHLEALLRTTTSLGEPLFACVLLADSGPEAGGTSRPLHAWLELIRTLPLELEPLSRAGLGGYVRRRLDYAGYRGDPIFAPTALDAVYGFTAGVPRAVNALCHLVLGEAYLRGETEVSAERVEQARNGTAPAEATTTAESEESALAPAARPEVVPAVPFYFDPYTAAVEPMWFSSAGASSHWATPWLAAALGVGLLLAAILAADPDARPDAELVGAPSAATEVPVIVPKPQAGF